MRASTLSFQPFMSMQLGAQPGYSHSVVRAAGDYNVRADLETSVWLQLADLTSMGFNWDRRGADAISPVTASRMLADMSSISEACPPLWAPWIVPGADGSLQAEWDTDELEILYLIDDEGRRSIYIEDRLAGEEYEAEGNAALTLASRCAKRLVDGQMAPCTKVVLDTGYSSSTTAYTRELEAA